MACNSRKVPSKTRMAARDSSCSLEASATRGESSGSRPSARSNVHRMTLAVRNTMRSRSGKGVVPSGIVSGRVKMMERVTAPFGPPTVSTSAFFNRLPMRSRQWGRRWRRCGVGEGWFVSTVSTFDAFFRNVRLPAATTAEAIDLLHDEHPPETARHDKRRDQRHHPQKERQREVIGNGRRESLGQLHPQKNEHHRVDEEHDDAPETAGHQLALGDGSGGEALGAVGHDEAGGHHGQNAGGAEPFGEQVHEERREHLVEHVDGGALVAAAPQGPHGIEAHQCPRARQPRCRRENRRPNSSAAPRAEKAPVRAAALANWKATTPDASLMSDSPESSVDWRFFRLTEEARAPTAAASVGASAAAQAKAAASGTEGTNQFSAKPTTSTVSSTSPTANDRMEPLFSHRSRGFVSRASLNRQRSDEQHEEQLGGDAHVVDGWNDQGHHRADGNLHKRQRQPRHDLAQHRRPDHAGQHDERQFQNRHARLLLTQFPIDGFDMPTPRLPCATSRTRFVPVTPPSRFALRKSILGIACPSPRPSAMPRSAEHAGNRTFRDGRTHGRKPGVHRLPVAKSGTQRFRSTLPYGEESGTRPQFAAEPKGRLRSSLPLCAIISPSEKPH